MNASRFQQQLGRKMSAVAPSSYAPSIPRSALEPWHPLKELRRQEAKTSAVWTYAKCELKPVASIAPKCPRFRCIEVTSTSSGLRQHKYRIAAANPHRSLEKVIAPGI
jgi:hypothetical protein